MSRKKPLKTRSEVQRGRFDQRGDVLAKNLDIAARRRNQPQRHANCRGFARAIGAEEAKDVSTMHFQIELIDGQSLSIVFCQIARTQHHFLRTSRSSGRLRRAHGS